MRYAIYFVPDAGDALRARAEPWLADHTVAARVYGFHATLKAPFHLAAGRSEGEVIDALRDFAAAQPAVGSVAVRIAPVDGFFAAIPRDSRPDLHGLADASVIHFDRFRRPASAEEIARRRPDLMTWRQRRNLQQWGYPYVFEDFRFHLTLTDLIDREDQDATYGQLVEYFGDTLEPGIVVDTVTLCRQSAAGEPFEAIAREPLTAPGTPVRVSLTHYPLLSKGPQADDE